MTCEIRGVPVYYEEHGEGITAIAYEKLFSDTDNSSCIK